MHRPPTRGLRMVPLLLVATAVSTAPLSAQCPSGVKPRVLVMVDSSASMTLHLGDSNPAWGDGSIRYTDAIMTRDLVQTPGFGLYTGYETGNPICPPGSPPITLGSYDGINSRLYAVKSALPGILNAPGEVDWGLMRFAGTTCPIVNTTTSNFVVCGNDSDCASGFFCLSGTCFKNNNLCALSPSYDQA